MAPTLYSTDVSPACRAILMISKALGVELNVQECNLATGDNLSPDFLKLNPQHTIPTMKDGDLVLGNSHAISTYLVEKYGKDDSLYPSDANKRALVNQRLFFNEGTAFQVVLYTMKYYLFPGKKEIPEAAKIRGKEVYDFLEIFLNGKKWVSGEDLSIADLHLVATITSLNVLIPMEEDKYSNIRGWLDRCQSLICYQENVKGLEMFKGLVSTLLQV